MPCRYEILKLIFHVHQHTRHWSGGNPIKRGGDLIPVPLGRKFVRDTVTPVSVKVLRIYEKTSN